MKTFLLTICCITLTACENPRVPSLSGNPSSLSADTLCYRAATTKNPLLTDEITRRNLDCRPILENDPLLVGRRY